MTDDETRRFLSHANGVSVPFQAGHWTQIAIAEPGTDRLIGDMGLHQSKDGSTAELGVTISRSFQRQGHASAAMKLAINLARGTDGINRIICGADARNTASLAMIEKLGFIWTHDEPAQDGQTDCMYELPGEQSA